MVNNEYSVYVKGKAYTMAQIMQVHSADTQDTAQDVSTKAAGEETANNVAEAAIDTEDADNNS